MAIGVGIGVPFKHSGGGGGGGVFVLDDYPAHVACSLQKLRSAYEGSAIRVRRSSDNAEQDIGFTDNALDSSSLLTFVGAGDGFVTIAYDQVGSSNFTQTTAARQPKVVSSGVMITDTNGLAAISLDGVNDHFNNNTLGGTTVLDAYRVGSTSDNRFMMFSGSASNQYSFVSSVGDGTTPSSSNYNSPSLYVNNVLKTSTTWGNCYTAIVLGTPTVVNHMGASTTGWSYFRVGKWTGGGYDYNGKVQAMVFYNADTTTNRAAIINLLTDTYVP